MPKKAQYPVSRLMRFSRFEAEALRFLGGPRGMSEALRSAVWYFLRHSGRFDADAFKKNLKGTDGPELTDAARKEIDAALATLADPSSEDTEGAGFQVDAAGVADWLGDAK